MAAEYCPTLASRSRKTHAVILQALSSKGQRPVAEALGVSEATVSRMKVEDLERFAAFLTAIGLKPVPLENRCYPPQHIQHLEYFAQLGMKHVNAADLLDEDAE